MELPIRDIKSGKYNGFAKNILFDGIGKNGHLEIDRENIAKAEIMAVKDIKGVGEDYILIEDDSALKRVLKMDDETRDILRDSYILLGIEVIEGVGNKLGKVIDLEVTEKGELSKIFLENGTEIEKDKVTSICMDAIFVNLSGEVIEEPIEESTAESIEEPTEESANESEEEPKEDEVIDEDEIAAMDLSGEDIASPIGLIVDKTVVSADEMFRVAEGTVITEEIFNEALKHDVLVELALCTR